jgi:hypothetical protein
VYYYFLLPALPPLTLKSAPEMTYKELKELFYLNLTPSDLKKFEVLLKPIDLYNIRAFWLGQPLDERGNLSGKELEDALLVQEELPSYLAEFLDHYESNLERLKAFPSLFASFFRESGDALEGFLKRYYSFERERMLILTALRAKATGRDIVKELQFEDPHDPFIVNILVQKDAADFIPPKEYEDLKILFVEKAHDPENLNRAILEYCLKKIEEMEDEESPFSIDQVLGYAARFLIIDSWFQLDREKGKGEVEKMCEYE